MRGKLGLIVNPIAGMGGSVGLKGTDGPETLAAARRLGAVPIAPRRALEALEQLVLGRDEVELLTYADAMGGTEARSCGLSPVVLRPETVPPTSARDTRSAAAELAAHGVSLLLFAGGDGTAADVLAAVGSSVPALGIPAGVKMHSAVFAVTPRAAGRLALAVLRGETRGAREGEVADVDEEALRRGVVSPRLHGFLRVPAEPRLVQGLKARSPGSDEAALLGIARQVAEELDDETVAIVGPGTTTAAILRSLGVEPTLLGVDAVRGGRLVARDAGERDLLDILDGARRVKVVVAPVGGQGFVLGRGNQQISAAVLERAGPESLVVVATEGKLASLGGRPLLVDTGDADLDRRLAGYVKVVTGHGRRAVYPVAA